MEAEHYHVGIVVPDIDAGRARLTALLGTTWGPVLAYDVAVRDGDGHDTTVAMRLCYSTTAPRLELIQEQPGTPWVCNEFSNLHHIGYYSDHLGDDAAGLVAAGCPLEVAGRDGDRAPTTFTYHRDPLGVRVELVDEAGRPAMEQYLFQPPADT